MQKNIEETFENIEKQNKTCKTKKPKRKLIENITNGHPH